jgi:hypothetical protein
MIVTLESGHGDAEYGEVGEAGKSGKGSGMKREVKEAIHSPCLVPTL